MNKPKPYRPAKWTWVRCPNSSVRNPQMTFARFERTENDGVEGERHVAVSTSGELWWVPELSVKPIHQPGIGAVVAMVAAARMAQGAWLISQCQDVIHWDWMPVHIACVDVLACGGGSPWDVGVPAGEIDDVDCPDCLKMYRRVYGDGKDTTQ